VKACPADGRYLAHVAPLGDFELRGAPGLAPNSDAVAVVRPEAIGPVTGPGDVSVDVTVTDVSFLGSQTQYTIESEALGTMLMVLNSADGWDGGPGARRQVGWPSEAMWLVAADRG
jgi:hypothetical protein